MTDLADLVEPLKRLVATPGTFSTVFPDSGDDDLLGSLQDGFAETQLDGFFNIPTAYVLDLDTGIVTPDLALAGRALIQIYAASNFVTALLINLKNQVKYEAKGTVYETAQAATVLTALLKGFADRKAAILVLLQQQNLAGAFHMADQYVIRATSWYPLAGYGPDDIGYSVGAIGAGSPYGF